MTTTPIPRKKIGTPKRAGPAPKKQPTRRISLIITPSHVTLAEVQNGKVKSVNSPTPVATILDSGAPGNFLELTGIIKRLRTELGSKTRNVDISLPDSFFQYALQQIPNVPKDAPDELLAAAQTRYNTDLNVALANTALSSTPLHHQSAVMTTYTNQQNLTSLLAAVVGAGLTPLTITPHAFNVARSLTIPQEPTALIHFEPNGTLLMTFDEGQLTYLEELRDVDRQILAATQEASQVSAYEKLAAGQAHDLSDVVMSIQHGLQSATDHLSSLGLSGLQHVLLSGSASESPLGQMLVQQLGRDVQFAVSNQPGDTPLLAGVTSRAKPGTTSLQNINLLTDSLNAAVQPKNAANTAMLLPLIAIAGLTLWTGYTYMHNQQLSAERSAKQNQLTQLEQFVGQQQKLQAENVSMQRTLSLRDELKNSSVDWPTQLKRLINNTPMENGAYIAHYAYMKPDLGMPDTARFGKVNVRYIYDVTVTSDTRAQMLAFIKAFNTSPFAIDVQRLEQTTAGTYRLTATIGVAP